MRPSSGGYRQVALSGGLLAQVADPAGRSWRPLTSPSAPARTLAMLRLGERDIGLPQVAMAGGQRGHAGTVAAGHQGVAA